ncbi:hypothetical protein [Limnobacter parvus]|uniref:Uncharacterized protein n=1 Tax=Limnobacter parvus TaxID=2939690 RepID=A0ABT1XEG5_9BURK|nr:hypothetical protein [Limnobacter parvus]MCR2745672.1 hypothetical protein [Limnobacter parvus]
MLNLFLFTELGKKHGRVSVSAFSRTLRMNSNGAVFFKCGPSKSTAELAEPVLTSLYHSGQSRMRDEPPAWLLAQFKPNR